MNASSVCELCATPGGEVLLRTDKLRVVLVDEPQYPGFCRVIWNAHVKEMSDLSSGDRQLLMEAVWQVEGALREAMSPDKINLASLGNMTPHLHWHIIPRNQDDAHFPSPIWADAERTGAPDVLVQRTARLPHLRRKIVANFHQEPT